MAARRFIKRHRRFGIFPSLKPIYMHLLEALVAVSSITPVHKYLLRNAFTEDAPDLYHLIFQRVSVVRITS